MPRRCGHLVEVTDVDHLARPAFFPFSRDAARCLAELGRVDLWCRLLAISAAFKAIAYGQIFTLGYVGAGGRISLRFLWRLCRRKN